MLSCGLLGMGEVWAAPRQASQEIVQFCMQLLKVTQITDDSISSKVDFRYYSFWVEVWFKQLIHYDNEAVSDAN